MDQLNILFFAIPFVFGAGFGYFIRQQVIKRRVASVEAEVEAKLENANKRGQEILIEAKQKAVKILEESKAEEKEQKNNLLKLQEKIVQRTDILEKKIFDLDKEKEVLQDRLEKARKIKEEIEEAKSRIMAEVEKRAGLSREEAKKELLGAVAEENKKELAELMLRFERERQDFVEKKTVDMILPALQRYGRSVVCEITTSIVDLSNDEIKGKIIGKEGRNIRHFERLTGVDVIVDETPNAIMLSSFDPMRREVARVALEKLIRDGRIQPAKIEEKVDEAKKDVQKVMREAGEAAAYEVGIYDFPPEVIMLLGRLRFRTSYGQNVLLHSIEMAHIAGLLAKELGLNADLAKKGALLHDIGKAVDHEVDGTHLEIGRRILQKYGVSEEVVKAMQSHHEDYPVEIPEAYIVNAADAISGARPGARRDTVENYLKRLEALEKIATSFDGVEKAYAVQAGREIRIFVTPTKVDDLTMIQIARDVAKRIEEELKYPGEIKVVTIRETRAVEVAR